MNSAAISSETRNSILGGSAYSLSLLTLRVITPANLLMLLGREQIRGKNGIFAAA
jgi:hypothetical protein